MSLARIVPPRALLRAAGSRLQQPHPLAPLLPLLHRPGQYAAPRSRPDALRVSASQGPKKDTALFGGEVSKAYGKFLKLNQPIFDATLSALKRDLAAIGAAKDAAGLNIVDIASGPGQPTLTIAEAFPGASITCTDISPDMVQSAKGNLASAKNVKFAVVDASDLSAFPDASFDVVTCVFGVMFVPDCEKALREFRRVLKPQGRAYVATWKAMPAISRLPLVLKDLTGEAQPQLPINPLRFSEDGSLDKLIASAGLTLAHPTTELRYDFDLGDDEGDAFFRGTLPINSALAALAEAAPDGPDAAWARARAAWRRIVVEDGGFRVSSGSIVYSGNTARLHTLRR